MSMLAPSIRDGFISIMRDKFQRCNVELLTAANMSRFALDQLTNEPVAATTSSTTGRHQTSAKQHHNAAADHNLNTEWSLMFGQQQQQPQQQNNRAANELVGGGDDSTSGSRLKSRGSMRGSPSEPPTPPSRISAAAGVTQSRKFHDCAFEVERYLDRAKMIYEDQRTKCARLSRVKEAINASLSSSQVCLSGKWRPRGHLVFHSNEHTKAIDRLSRNADATYFSTLSSAEGCVKIWSTESLLTAKSGFYKSVFTYDRQNHAGGGGGGASDQLNMFRPACTSFFNRHSLAILCEDFRFYVIDFNSERTHYRLLSFEKLFKANACKSVIVTNSNCYGNSNG